MKKMGKPSNGVQIVTFYVSDHQLDNHEEWLVKIRAAAKKRFARQNKRTRETTPDNTESGTEKKSAKLELSDRLLIALTTRVGLSDAQIDDIISEGGGN